MALLDQKQVCICHSDLGWKHVEGILQVTGPRVGRDGRELCHRVINVNSTYLYDPI